MIRAQFEDQSNVKLSLCSNEYFSKLLFEDSLGDNGRSLAAWNYPTHNNEKNLSKNHMPSGKVPDLHFSTTTIKRKLC